MKKLLFGVVALALMASCSGNSNSQKAAEDSVRMADSIAQVAADQARIDSIRQDSIAKAEVEAKAAAEYDGLIAQYVSAVDKVASSAKRGNFSNMANLLSKCGNLDKKISKIKENLNEEQLSKYKKAQAKYIKLINGVVAA